MQPDALLFAAAPHLTARWHRQYIQRLTGWFAEHQRDLPWRRTRDPYAIWLSESMLQQTQVATVIDYFERFLAHFPSVDALAAADEQSVLSLWAGLGYYRRARQLHAAAKKVVADHSGVFPNSVTDLMELPGVGRYTAGAIVSIAFDLPAPIVEANTERLFARLLQLELAPRSRQGTALLWQFAEWQLPDKSKPGSRHINQAAMELGALICKPLRPLCSSCPVVKLCPTAERGLQATIPLPKPKKEFTQLHHVALIIARDGRWLVRLNPQGAWWTGLWDFPRVDITTIAAQISTGRGRRHDPPSPATMNEVFEHIEAAAVSQLQLSTKVLQPLFALAHGVTRYRIKLDCVAATGAEVIRPPALSHEQPAHDSRPASKVRNDALASHSASTQTRETAPTGWRWATRAELAQLPLTAPARKILDRLLAE